jgi:hypothetical protein
MRGVAGWAADDVFDGDCGAVLSGGLSRAETENYVAELAVNRFGWA